jgi:hypothetical protein
MTGLSGQDNQDRIARTGLPGYGRDRIGLPPQDWKNKTARGRKERRRQPEKDRHARQLEQDNQNGAARMRRDKTRL